MGAVASACGQRSVSHPQSSVGSRTGAPHGWSLFDPLEPSYFQGFTYAERPKDTAPLQTRSAPHFPPKAVDAECRSRQTERFRKRATKLRAISCASPRRSPVWQHCRGGKLLPTRRTLLQIAVSGPRRGIVTARTFILRFYGSCRSRILPWPFPPRLKWVYGRHRQLGAGVVLQRTAQIRDAGQQTGTWTALMVSERSASLRTPAR
jgi:hypothetical protein